MVEVDYRQIAREACERLIEFAPPNQVDDYARKQLSTEFKKRHVIRLPMVAKTEWVVNNKRADNLLDALSRIEECEEIGVNFTGMPLEPIWEYDTPTRRLKTSKSGKGGILHFPKKRVPSGVGWDPLGDPFLEKAMLMVYTTKWFIPESIKTVTERPADQAPPKPPKILPLHQWWRSVRRIGFVPFEIVVCAYTQKKRFMYTLDLVNNVALRDFRQGLFSRKRVERSVLDFMYLDTAFSTNMLKEIQKRAMMYVFEVENSTAQEVAFGFKVTDKMARNHLYGLVKKDLVKMTGEPPGELYNADLDKLRENKGEIG